MGSEITYRKLKDCAVWYSGGTPRKSNAEYWNGTIPWISAKSLHGTFICDSEDKVTELGAQNGTRLVQEGTILFVVRGMSLKNEFRVGLTTDTVTFNQDLKALLPVEGIDPHYLLYFLKSKAKDILSLVEEAGHGTGVLPTAVLQELDVPVPPLQQQKLVAKAILNFDEKIEINRQISQTLEQMAQTLFKSWFVDFDPVIDNALDAGSDIPEVFETRVERRKAVRESADFKPLPDDVRQLFPSEFEESELGWVPKGWTVFTLKSLSEKISKGTTPSKKDLSDAQDEASIKFIKVKDINDRGEVTREQLERIPRSIHENKLKRSILETEDILFSIAGTIGRVAILDNELNNVNTNQAVAFIRLKDKKRLVPLVYMTLRASRLQQKAMASIVQGVQANLSLTNIGEMEVVVPSSGVLNFWNKQCSSCLNKSKRNLAQSRALATLRDTLLPKLISGELRLDSPEVEHAKALVE